MMLINVNKIFEDAINEKRVDTAENLLQCSDSKCELMRNYSRSNSIQNLLCMLCEFKSKGLVMNIESICTQHKDFKSCFVGNDVFKSQKKVYQHEANQKSNEKKHLSGSSFTPKKQQENSLSCIINKDTKKSSSNIHNVTINNEEYVVYQE